MSKKLSVVVSFVFGLAAGCVAAYFTMFAPSFASVSEPEPVRAPAPIPDKGAEASNAALRARVAELERLLAEANGRAEEGQTNAVAEAVPPQPNGWRERMERLKADDPARYNETTNRLAEFRRMRNAQANSKLGFLASVDTSRMSAGARANHERLRELIAAQEEIEKRLQDNEMPGEERHALFGEMMRNFGEIGEANRREREELIRQTGEMLGFEGGDASDFEATIREIIDATDNGFGLGPAAFRGHGGPGGRGHGGRGGPRHGGDGR